MLSEKSVVKWCERMRINWIIHLCFFILSALTPLGCVNYRAVGVLEKTILLAVVINSQFISQHVFFGKTDSRKSVKL